MRAFTRASASLKLAQAADRAHPKWLLTGTTRDGERKEVHGCDFYTFRDGKVTRKDSYWKIVE